MTMISKRPKDRRAAGNSAAVWHESQGGSLWITALRTTSNKTRQRREQDKRLLPVVFIFLVVFVLCLFLFSLSCLVLWCVLVLLWCVVDRVLIDVRFVGLFIFSAFPFLLRCAFMPCFSLYFLFVCCFVLPAVFSCMCLVLVFGKTERLFSWKITSLSIHPLSNPVRYMKLFLSFAFVLNRQI
jgi:hypothetical protein